ncbi:MAG: hypothetical protein LBM16_05570 [Clostridiales bacterium]|nr:hypothetical protein [Clostridiales bacterium]
MATQAGKARRLTDLLKATDLLIEEIRKAAHLQVTGERVHNLHLDRVVIKVRKERVIKARREPVTIEVRKEPDLRSPATKIKMPMQNVRKDRQQNR